MRKADGFLLQDALLALLVLLLVGMLLEMDAGMMKGGQYVLEPEINDTWFYAD